MNKEFKYRLLRHLPGRTGRRYGRKFLRLHTRERLFPEAVRRCEGMTCIDLGAHVGEYTRKLARSAGHVIAFEPDPWTHGRLRSNVAGLDNVTIENAAAGTKEGRVPFYRHVRFAEDPALYSISGSVIADKRNVAREGAIEVRQVDFPGYLETLDREIGILKIDIEGAEVELLEALLSRPDLVSRIHWIFAETHETRIPGHGPRVSSLRNRAGEMQRPRINLHWS